MTPAAEAEPAATAAPVASAALSVPAVEPTEPTSAGVAVPSVVEAPTPIVAPRYDAHYLDNAPPSYPPLARQLREQGVVMLNVRVSTSGAPEVVEIHVSSGSTRLDEAARLTVAQWRFVPARQGTAPVAAWVVVPVRFTLRG